MARLPFAVLNRRTCRPQGNKRCLEGSALALCAGTLKAIYARQSILVPHMNIVVLENQPSSRRGGQELSLFDVCQELAAKGHSITLLYTSTGNLLEQYATFCDRLIQVSHYRFDAKRPLRSLGALLSDLRKTYAVKADVVYSNQYHDSFFGYLLACLKRVPFVCHLRLPPPDKLGWQWNLGMQGAKQLISVSAHTKQAWSQVGFSPEIIDVVHNGIDETKFLPTETLLLPRQQLNLPKTGFIVSYVGRLDRHKGTETLIKGFAELRKTNPSVHLAIAGKTHNDNAAYLTELQSLTAHLNVKDAVTFLGHVDSPAQVYQASDLVVLPSEWPEPFGRTVIESLSCGVPVVASRVGGIPEILTDQLSQGLFESANPQSLAQRLQQHILWREHTPRLGEECRRHVVDHFALHSALKKIETTLLKAVSA